MRQRQTERSMTTGQIVWTLLASSVIGPGIAIALAITLFPFLSEQAFSAQPVTFLPKITSIHIGFGGMAMLLLCALFVYLLIQFEPDASHVNEGEFSVSGGFDDKLTASMDDVEGGIDLVAAQATENFHPQTIETIQPGWKIGPYTLSSFIGKGKFGRVWKAHFEGSEYAVKIQDAIPSSTRLSPQQEAKKFEAANGHPNIVRVFESGVMEVFAADSELQTLNIRVFSIVMEFVGGGTLADTLNSAGQLPLGDALAICFEVTDGLAHLHELGLIHRDVKPANILLDNGVPKLADFGLSRFDDEPQSNYGAVGTIDYMSPETIRGERKPSGDIWALAVTFHEMLTGKCPQWDQGELKLSDNTPSELQEFFQSTFHSDPAKRTSTATQFRTRLKMAVHRV